MNMVQPKEEAIKPCQLVLETQAAPALIRAVGERQSGRVTAASIEAYLDRHHLRFDRNLLRSMFEEADYKHEGSLAPKDLLAAIAGRYPKRQHTSNWRSLAALLLGVPALKLLDVDREPVSLHRKHAVFAYSAWPDVEDLPPPPKNTQRRQRPTAPNNATASQPAASLTDQKPQPLEWQAVLSRAEAALGEGQLTASAAGSSQHPPQLTAAGGASGALDSSVCADRASQLLVRTSRGVLSLGKVFAGPPRSPENEINSILGLHAMGPDENAPNWVMAGQEATAAGQQQQRDDSAHAATAAVMSKGPPRFSFNAAARFSGHLEQTQLVSTLQTEAAAAETLPTSTPIPKQQSFRQWLQQDGGSSNAATPASSSRATAAATTPAGAELPPRAVALDSSALARLRAAVKSDAERRPPFLLNFHPLLPGDEDRSRSLGLPLDTRRV